jgi:hypothetical protein
MSTRTLVSRSRRGSALLFSVVAVMVVSILAAGFLQLALSVTRRLNSSSDSLQALNLAEAGLAEAYTGLAAARTGNVGSSESPAIFGGGMFWVEATQDFDGLVELECTALYGTGRATLGLVCEPVGIGVGSLGFFTNDDLRLNPNARLDSYDSLLGSYEDQLNTALNNQVLVGSNQDVSIASGNVIFGDVVNGPVGSTAVANGAIVTGGTSSRPEEEVMPLVEVPDIPLAPGIKHASGAPLIIPPGEAGYQSLEIGKSAKVVLKGPLRLVVGSLELRIYADMEFDTTDGPVELFVTKSLDLKTDSTLTTTTQIPADSLIFVSAPGKSVSFGAKSQFFGFVYAPLAEVHVAAQFELFGGLVCDSLQLAAQGKLHYDLSLGATLAARLPILRSWRVVELPRAVAARRIDPFTTLGIDRATLLPPAESHLDQVLDVRYIAQDGSTDSYFGHESDFDWDLVKELIYGVRDGLAFFLPEDYGDVVADDPLKSLVESSLSSKDLRDVLLAADTLTNEVLEAACERDPPMSESDLEAVLAKVTPLGDSVLKAAIGSDALDSGSLKSVLIDNSPLSLDVLAAAIARIPPLSLSDLTSVLAKQ